MTYPKRSVAAAACALAACFLPAAAQQLEVPTKELVAELDNSNLQRRLPNGSPQIVASGANEDAG